MNQGQFVYSQLVSHLDRIHFNFLARKYDVSKYVKHFSCWNQLLAMMFGQLLNRESLRDVLVALEAHHSKCKFLGIGSKPIAKTTLIRSRGSGVLQRMPSVSRLLLSS